MIQKLSVCYLGVSIILSTLSFLTGETSHWYTFIYIGPIKRYVVYH